MVRDERPVSLPALTRSTSLIRRCLDLHRLVLGFDLANTTLMARNYKIIGNKAAIAINQAYAGHPGRLIKNASQTFVAATGHGAGFIQCYIPGIARNFCDNVTFPVSQVWAKPLPNGEHAVLLINLSEETQTVGVSPAELGLVWRSSSQVDVWTGKLFVGNLTAGVRLAPHDNAFIKITSEEA